MAINGSQFGNSHIIGSGAFSCITGQSNMIVRDLSGQAATPEDYRLRQFQRARNAEISARADIESGRRRFSGLDDPLLELMDKPLTLQEELQQETNEWLKGI